MFNLQWLATPIAAGVLESSSNTIKQLTMRQLCPAKSPLFASVKRQQIFRINAFTKLPSSADEFEFSDPVLKRCIDNEIRILSIGLVDT